MVSKKHKLIERFCATPNDFHYSELVRLLGYFGYYEVRMGKRSGSRVRFRNEEGVDITLHKPHPNGIMKRYQLRQIIEILGL